MPASIRRSRDGCAQRPSAGELWDLEISLRDTAGERGAQDASHLEGFLIPSSKTGASAGRGQSLDGGGGGGVRGKRDKAFFAKPRSRRYLDILRIITGNLKGRTIPFSPKRHGDIRITSSRLKEAIFASMGGDLDGQAFLDLCAGSGQIGLEAHSRGARVTSVEPDFRRYTCLKKLLADWDVGHDMELIHTEAQHLIPQLEQRERRFDAVYVDPPYDATLGVEPLCLALLGKLGCSEVLRREGQVMVQHSRRLELPAEVGGLSCHKQRIYGDTVLSVYRPPRP